MEICWAFIFVTTPFRCSIIALSEYEKRRSIDFILELSGVLDGDGIIISQQHPGFIIGSVQIVVSTAASSRDVMFHAYQEFEALFDDHTFFIDTR